MVVLSILRQVLIGLGLGAPFSFFERRLAAHRVSHREFLARDVGAFVIVLLLNFPGGAISGFLLSNIPFITALRAPHLPLAVSVPLAIVGSDFAVYWSHRLIHTRSLWRVHRWHHSPRHMYWLAGARQSLLQGVIYSANFLVFFTLNVPDFVMGRYIIFGVILNHWMHSNLNIRSSWLESIFVTPRIHHIHHSADPKHANRNFGSMLCIWDRMFGTFLDPDDVRAPLEFGIPEAVSGPRMIVGV